MTFLQRLIHIPTSRSARVWLPLASLAAGLLLATLTLSAPWAINPALAAALAPPAQPALQCGGFDVFCTNNPPANCSIIPFSNCQPSCQQIAVFCVSCPQPACGPVCGNGSCEAGETSASCFADCACSTSFCGDGVCLCGETSGACPGDCGTSCGDGVCNGGEDASNCAADCAPPNQPPTVVGETVALDEDTTLAINVTANDSDPDGALDPGSVTIITPPANGAAQANIPTAGGVTYTPAPDFFGSDSFVYQVCDTGGACSSATVSITVNPVDDPPVVLPDSPSVDEDNTATIDVLANDSDPDGNLDPGSLIITAGPSNGSASINPSYQIVYTPSPDWFGTDTLTYQVCDTTGLCDTATVTITVNPINDPPVVADDGALATQGIPTVIPVLANDSDVDGTLDPGSVTITTPPSFGTATVNPATGDITYTPSTGATVTDSFSYQVCDNDGACSTGTVSTLNNMADLPPVANPDAPTTNEDNSLTFNPCANDTDPNNNLNPGSTTIATPSGSGTATTTPGTCDLTYIPDPDFNGIDSFTYQVCDTGGLCATGTITITVSAVNDAPYAANDGVSTLINTPVSLDPLANDSDVDNPMTGATLILTSSPANGTATLSGNTVTYQPAQSWTGTDSFSYQVCDVGGACSTAIISVVVQPQPVVAPTLTPFDPVISKHGSPTSATRGETVTWTITVSNVNSTPSQPFSFQDPMPEMFDIQRVDISGPATHSIAGQVITFDVGTLTPSETVTITITTVVNALAGPGEACNTLHSGGSSIVTPACIQLYPDHLPDTGAGFRLPSVAVGGTALLAAAALALSSLRRRRLIVTRVR